jgi:DNA polymerase (family 10)
VAAATVQNLPFELEEHVAAGRALTEIPGIGAGIEKKIRALMEEGSLELIDTLKTVVPESALELLRIRGLGPARVRYLHRTLGVSGIDDLVPLLDSGRLSQAKGFGDKTAAALRRTLAEYLAHRGRRLRFHFQPAVDLVSRHLALCPRVLAASVAGSYRRGLETARGLTLVAATDDADAVLDHLTRWEDLSRINERHPDRLLFNLGGDTPVTVHLCAPDRFGAVLHHRTGSAAHVAAMAAFARSSGLRLAEGGLYRSDNSLVPTPDEAALFAALGLPAIPAELREDRGELPAAAAGALPRLLGTNDLYGDLHVHTTFTDGHHSVREMALAGRACGYDYIAIADHSKNAVVANGLSESQLPGYLDEIDAVNRADLGIRVLKALEVDVLRDGRLDMPDVLLERLDLVIASIHGHFNLPEEEMTARVLRAIEHPLVRILAHPTTRLIGSRSPILFDLERVMRRAAELGVWLELNANPERLDLDDRACRAARDLGVGIALSTDAHSIAALSNIEYGVIQARRGWLEPRDVVNARAGEEFYKLLSAPPRPTPLLTI